MAAVAVSTATTAHADSQLDTNRLRAAQRLGASSLDGLVTRQRHTNAALAFDFRLAEQAQRGVFLTQRGTEVGETCLLRIALNQNHRLSRWAHLANNRNRQAENGARMQGELGQLLRDQRHQARVVRARRDLTEPYLVTLDEQLDAEQTAPAQRFGHCQRHALGLGQGLGAHRLRLPGLLIVAVFLAMANRRT